MLRLIPLAAGALLLLGAPAIAVSPFPLLCTNDTDGIEWVIDGQTITQDSPYAATSVGVLMEHKESYSRILNQSLMFRNLPPEEKVAGPGWLVVYPGGATQTLTIKDNRFNLLTHGDRYLNSGTCKKLDYTTPSLFRRETDRRYARPFRPVVCVVNRGDKPERFRFDGTILASLDHPDERFSLWKHRTMGDTDYWAFLTAGDRGSLTIEKRRELMWNPAGTVKFLGTCRDAPAGR